MTLGGWRMADAVTGSGAERAHVRWYRAAAIGFSLVFLIFAAWAAWRPESRLSPPLRASACSLVSTVSTPKAHGTPVRSWTSCNPRAASAQT